MTAKRTLWALLITLWANNALGDVLVQPGYGQPHQLTPQLHANQHFTPSVLAGADGQLDVARYAQHHTTGPYHLEVHPIYEDEAQVGIPSLYGRTLHVPHHQLTRLGGYTHMGPSLVIGHPHNPLAVHHRYRRSAGSGTGAETPDEDGLAPESSLGETSPVADLQTGVEETADNKNEEYAEPGEGSIDGRDAGAPLLKRASPNIYSPEQFNVHESATPRGRPLRPIDHVPTFDPRYARSWPPVQQRNPLLGRNYPDPRPYPPMIPTADRGSPYQGRYRKPYPPAPQVAPNQGYDEYNRGEEIVGTKLGKLHKHHAMKHYHHHHPMKVVDPPHYECPQPPVCCNQPCKTNPPVYVIYKPNEPITNPPCVTPEPPTTPCPVQICEPPNPPPPCPPPPCPPPPCPPPQICEPPTVPCPEPPPCPTPEPPPVVDCPPQQFVILPPCNNCPPNCNCDTGYVNAPAYTITATAS